MLADAERPALLQERVDERRLPVVDVRDDGDRAAVGPSRGGEATVSFAVVAMVLSVRPGASGQNGEAYTDRVRRASAI